VAERIGAEEKARVQAVVMQGAAVRERNGARKDEVVSLHRLLVAPVRLLETFIAVDIDG
jgi:hypothetical protein